MSNVGLIEVNEVEGCCACEDSSDEAEESDSPEKDF